MLLINCEISLVLTLLKNCFFSTGIAYQESISTIVDTKLYVPVVTLSTKDNAKLLKRLQSDFKRTTNWK